MSEQSTDKIGIPSQFIFSQQKIARSIFEIGLKLIDLNILSERSTNHMHLQLVWIEFPSLHRKGNRPNRTK